MFEKDAEKIALRKCLAEMLLALKSRTE